MRSIQHSNVFWINYSIIFIFAFYRICEKYSFSFANVIVLSLGYYIFHGKINDKSQSAAIAPNRNTMKYNLEILFLNNLFKVRQALAVPIKVIVLLILWFIQQHRQQIQSSTWLHADWPYSYFVRPFFIFNDRIVYELFLFFPPWLR